MQPDRDDGSGWLGFACSMLAIVAILNFIFGLAAISASAFYARDADYVLTDLNTLGWVLLVIGVVQFSAIFSIWAGTDWGRWVGIAAAAVNSVVQLIFLPSFPLAALAVFALDVLVIYGLMTAAPLPRRTGVGAARW
jgi:hypothetical protein